MLAVYRNLLNASKETELEVNARHYTPFMSGHQNVGQNYRIQTTNNPFETVAKLKYLGNESNESKSDSRKTKVTMIQGIHRAQNLLSSRFMSKSLEIKIHFKTYYLIA
jgi:hypothetical protein